MHGFLASADDMLAVTVSGKITGSDLDAMIDRMESMLVRHDRIHVFVETSGIDGIDISNLPSYMARAMPLLGKLRQFGRVAVVADQAWVRIGSRIESALLPFISYRVFKPDQRAEALAWVEGGSRGGTTPDISPGT